jgi:hypothetical protein
MKQLLVMAIAICLTSLAKAQQFEPAPSAVQSKLEQSMKRFGTVERMYLTDAKAQTIDLKDGGEYVIGFAYDINTKTTRRMLVYEVGPKGEKINLQYPSYSKGYRGVPGIQFFHVFVTPKGDGNTVHKYKIDADDAATVYIYKLIPGVKN